MRIVSAQRNFFFLLRTFSKHIPAAMEVPSVEILPDMAMPMFGLGTFRINGSEVHPALQAALSSNYRFIDTAQQYNNETEIGESLQLLLSEHGLERKDVFLTTKLKPDNMSREKVRVSLEKSLKELQTEYVDLFLIHYPQGGWTHNGNHNNKQTRMEVWKEMESLHREGVARAIGVSNYEVKHLKELEDYCTTIPAVNQIELHPHFTRSDIVDHCRSTGIHVQAFTSLGRFHPDLHNDTTLTRIAAKHGATVAEILLAWPLALGISVIPKSSRPQRVHSEILQAPESSVQPKGPPNTTLTGRRTRHSKIEPKPALH